MNTSPAHIQIGSALSLLGNGSRSVREMRSRILGLEAAMQAIPGHIKGEDFKTTHHFEPGVYIRQLFIPKDTVLTGKIHKTDHLNILSQGDITVWTEDGMKRLKASTVIQSQRGMKRVGFAHEDTVWITVHQNPSDERDIKNVEARLFSDTFDEAYSTSGRSFEEAIRYLGFSLEEVSAISENPFDQIPFPPDTSGIRVELSKVHGRGLFASREFEQGDVIAPARISGKRTPAGRFCNHSGHPNAEMIMHENGDVDLVALKLISQGEEIFNDYYLGFIKTRVMEDTCLALQ